MVDRYLRQLKEKTEMSWADIALASRIPESTLRKIFSGETKSPSFDTVMQIVIAMGGSISDLVAGVDPNTAIDPNHVISKAHEYQPEGCRGLHGDCHMVASVANTYEARIIDLKESFTERSMHYRNQNDARLDDIKRDKLILAIALASLLLFLLLMIVIDLCVSARGWIQY